MGIDVSTAKIEVSCHRKVKLGVGAEILVGGTLNYTPDPAAGPMTTQFEGGLGRISQIVNKFADQIEANVLEPDKWPGKAKA